MRGSAGKPKKEPFSSETTAPMAKKPRPLKKGETKITEGQTNRIADAEKEKAERGNKGKRAQ